MRGYQKGINVENPDLFVFDWYICFGAVIKRGKDQLEKVEKSG